jgi:hypothetical protein
VLYLRYRDIRCNGQKILYHEDVTTIDLVEKEISEIDLSPLSDCPNLKQVNLMMNKIYQIDLSPLSDCQELQILNLSYNRLKEIDLSPLRECTNLSILNLQFNLLENIDFWPFIDSTNLVGVHILGNMMKNPIDITPLILNPHITRINPTGNFNTYVSSPIARHLRNTGYSQENGEVIEDTWEILSRALHFPNPIEIQYQVLWSLGLQDYGFIDVDITDILRKIPRHLSMKEAREQIEAIVISVMCEQIRRGGTTIGLKTEKILNTAELVVLFDRIVKMRNKEIEEVMLSMQDNRVDLLPLWFTAYGYDILSALNLGATIDVIDYTTVEKAILKLGGHLFVVEKDIDQHTKINTRELKNFILLKIPRKKAWEV